MAYRLKLSERMKLHPYFHVSFLKPYFEDADHDKQQVWQVLSNMRKQFDKQVSTWERVAMLWQLKDRIKENLETHLKRTLAKVNGLGR